MKNRKEKRKYVDRREYIINAVDRRRKVLKEKAINYKGGKCVFCGYKKCNQALEFHHLGSYEKDFGVSAKGYTRSWSKVRDELDKCILVCSNCHREIHAGMTRAALPRNRH